GIPEGGRLNSGVDMGGGNWLLPSRRLNGLTINLPATAPEAVPIHVQLLDSNARMPLSAKTEFTIRVESSKTAAATQIASAAPPSTPFPEPPAAPSASPRPEVESLIREGNKRM